MNPMVEPLTIRSVVTRYYSSWSAGRRVRPDASKTAWSIMRCHFADRKLVPAGRHAEPAGVNRLDPEHCPVCNTCVTVRLVTRGILEIQRPDLRPPALSACLTHPP